MYRFIVRLPLIGECTISLREKKIYEFAMRQLTNYLIESVDSEIYSKKENGIANIYITNDEIVKNYRQYAKENIGLSNELLWNSNEIEANGYLFRILKDELNITIIKAISTSQKMKNFYHILKSNTEEKKYAILGNKFYDYVLFPLFTVYAACFGLFCIHGSLIKDKNNKNILITGLNGVGKSTLSDMICESNENILLADNIVLFDGVNGLNFNLAMRLEVDSPTKMPVIYQNSKIKEVLATNFDYGLRKIDAIYNLFRSVERQELRVTKKIIPAYAWIKYLEIAPEVGNANDILASWFFLYSFWHNQEFKNFEINFLEVPDNKLIYAKELITNELEVFN